MSRIGNKLIETPKGVTVTQEGARATVEGPKGTLTVPVPAGIAIEKSDGRLRLRRDSDEHAAIHGMTRALLSNAIQGVTRGFEKHLDIVGIGYRAESKGRVVQFTLGYSHPIDFALPEGITVTVEKLTHLVVSGADRQQVGQVAANMRSLRPPDPYKNKGVRYTGEKLKKKAGKAVGAATGVAAKQ
ncbi:MAG: 50S ribosomal protein L6 [Acidobacteria bacterium]|nr:50S ribosomal protein L6 [Acidobacteriota bacterium]